MGCRVINGPYYSMTDSAKGDKWPLLFYGPRGACREECYALGGLLPSFFPILGQLQKWFTLRNERIHGVGGKI